MSKGNALSCETQWMLAVRDRRDRQAFGNLFDHFAPKVKAMAMKGGSFTNNDAEDIVQDVMLTLWNKAYLYDPARAPLAAWVYQIARNRQIDVIRKTRRPVPEELIVDDVSDDDSFLSLSIEEETGELRQALERLNPDQRLLVEKAYLGELSHSEIQNETGLPLGTIKSRIRLGLKRLKQELKGLRPS